MKMTVITSHTHTHSQELMHDGRFSFLLIQTGKKDEHQILSNRRKEKKNPSRNWKQKMKTPESGHLLEDKHQIDTCRGGRSRGGEMKPYTLVWTNDLDDMEYYWAAAPSVVTVVINKQVYVKWNLLAASHSDLLNVPWKKTNKHQKEHESRDRGQGWGQKTV